MVVKIGSKYVYCRESSRLEADRLHTASSFRFSISPSENNEIPKILYLISLTTKWQLKKVYLR